MENGTQNEQVSHIDEQKLASEDMAQVSGGHSHARPAYYQCRKCGKECPSFAAYREHCEMIHGT